MDVNGIPKDPRDDCIFAYMNGWFLYNRPMDPLGMSLGFVSGDLRRQYINGSRESNVVD